MIAQLTGQLAQLDTDANTVLLEVAQVGYEVMVPGYSVSDLSAQLGRSVTLHCLEYHEATGGMGGNLIPRIIGFPQMQDKAFFQRFISVKGIGIRKALRALARPLGEIAASIEAGDAKMLATLPEIGKRTAEQIIAELKGKMDAFALAAGTAAAAETPLTRMQQETLEVLLQLGERRTEAQELIRRATETQPQIETTDALIQSVYRLKAGVL